MRKKKSVQNAEQQKSEKFKEPKPKPDNVEVVSKEEAPTASPKEVSKLIEIPQIDEDTKKMLLKAGLSWDSVTQAFEKVNVWAESVDARFNVILEKMPTEKGIAEELVKRSMEERQKLAQAAPPVSTGNARAAAPQDLGGLLQLIGPLLGGGGSSEMQDKIMNMAIESMGLGNALVKAIILKTAPELATQLLPKPAGV